MDPVREEAETFLEACAREFGWTYARHRLRWAYVSRELAETGTYTHTPQELAFGAKLAWYNHNRCIGKLHWRTLAVRDCRTERTGKAIAESLQIHLEQAFNGGWIQPVISIFAPDAPGLPGPSIVSSQLVQYAGYDEPTGKVRGDPANRGITRQLENLGWAPGRGAFDRLPVLIDDGELTWHELDERDCPDVLITHPQLADLGMRWYAFPTVSNMRLEIGGINYPAAPFTGWYVSTEIGARDFGDRNRYDLLPAVAQCLGLDTSNDRTLWKDRALLELNIAVLTSFKAAGVRMVDHHTMADQFHRFVQAQQRNGHTVTGEWGWLVPPMAGSATPVFHETYDTTVRRPNFFRD